MRQSWAISSHHHWNVTFSRLCATASRHSDRGPVAGQHGESDRQRDARFPRGGVNTNVEGGWM
jgi:hypothetical protein